MEAKRGLNRHTLLLVACDLIWLVCAALLVFLVNPSKSESYVFGDIVGQIIIASFCMVLMRTLFGVYTYVWRYGKSRLNLRLILGDVAAGLLYYFLQRVIPVVSTRFIRAVAFFALICLGSLGMRQIYQYLYESQSWGKELAGGIRKLMGRLFGIQIDSGLAASEAKKINIAIVGAGRVGNSLVEDLLNNPNAAYAPVLFIDVDKNKISRSINDIPVIGENQVTDLVLARFEVQEIVFAVTSAGTEKTKRLFEFYKQFGCKMKTYDYPFSAAEGIGGRRFLREFDVEELLFRKPIVINNEKTNAYYTGKTVMITGGGGSIGSELCRQIAKMSPKRLIVLDVYENTAYDIQQELKIQYGPALDLRVEILSVTNRSALTRVFEEYRPEIVIHAAAHKHVPLMEKNVVEAVENNVFGTLNVVELSEQYGVSRFMMVSTDKAVNPTNVMGATKRMCEIIVRAHSVSKSRGETTYSTTRFGNVLGSAGSVIPLFKRQIAKGGPVTLTDDRIVRYFMTIPEASQLVLESGALAQNGELFVLDMGQPVRIRDLAENMIRLSGLEVGKDIQIVTTGLRPGEKLYEELLVKTDQMKRTENDLIFVEKDMSISLEELQEKLDSLRSALATGSDEKVRTCLKAVVPTYHDPKKVNEDALQRGGGNLPGSLRGIGKQ